jgi:hypothetical protein
LVTPGLLIGPSRETLQPWSSLGSRIGSALAMEAGLPKRHHDRRPRQTALPLRSGVLRFAGLRIALGLFSEIAAAPDMILSVRDGSASAVAGANRNLISSPENKGFCNLPWPQFGTGGCVYDAMVPKRIIHLFRSNCITTMVLAVKSSPNSN